MKPMRYILAAAALGLFGQTALAFQETTVGPGDQKTPPAAAAPLPQVTVDPSKGLNVTTPELHLGQTPGTEVRIPGVGTVGVLPKLDLGLEILHGANEQKGPLQDKTDPDDVQLRGTVKYRF
jgi:hypothetical protein